MSMMTSGTLVEESKLRMQIEPIIAPPLPPDFEELNWPPLKKAVQAIFEAPDQSESSNSSFKPFEPCEVSYNRVVDYCHAGFARSLLTKLLVTLDEHVRELPKTCSSLPKMVQVWKRYQHDLVTIKNIFTFLDRTYVLIQQNQVAQVIAEISSTSPNVAKGPGSLFTIGIRKFAEYIFLDQGSSVLGEIVCGVIELVRNERNEAFERGIYRGAVAGTPSISSALPEDRMMGIESAAVDDEQKLHHRDRRLIHDVLAMMVDLNLYQDRFEQAFWDDTRYYYGMEAAWLLSGGGKQPRSSLDSTTNHMCLPEIEGAPGSECQFDLGHYVRHCDRRLEEELGRVQAYLLPGTQPQLIATVKDMMVREHAESLVGSGLWKLLEETATADLNRLFNLLFRVSMIEKLRTRFSDYVIKKGTEIVSEQVVAHDHVGPPAQGPSSPTKKLAGNVVRAGKDTPGHSTNAITRKEIEMVDRLLTFKRRMDNILTNSFMCDESFSKTLKDGFEVFINSRQNKPAELIAKWIDIKLKASKSNKGISESVLEQEMDDLLVLFRFIHGKDVFERFYKEDLARRLLLDRSASVDAEKSMISRLKTECGPGFTFKLEGMFKDMDVSRDEMRSFRETERLHKKLSVDLSVSVLTTGTWPHYDDTPVELPESMKRVQEVYKEYYLGRYKGRRLTWQNSLGQCNVRARYTKGNKEFVMSLHQTVILLLFNQVDCAPYNVSASAPTFYTFKQLMSLTKLDDPNELEKHLRSLCFSAHPILLARKKGSNKDDSEFRINNEFEHHLTKVKVNAVQLKETPEDAIKTTESVFQDRQYQVDAAIVRILKTHKRIHHTQLVTELIQMCPFPATAADYKRRIESLMDRDYLERDDTDPQIYKYLA